MKEGIIMNKLLYLLIEFVLAFILVYLMYRLFVIKKSKNNKKSNKKKEIKKDNKKTKKILKKDIEKKTPAELELFINLNKLDAKELNKDKLMNRLALLNAFDIAFVLLLTEVTDSIFLKAIIALFAIFIVLIISYKLYGSKFKKKEVAKEDVRS